MFGRNDFLGEVTLPLKMTDLANPMPKWYKLQEKVSYSSALRNKKLNLYYIFNPFEVLKIE
jgi:hypothetical protein